MKQKPIIIFLVFLSVTSLLFGQKTFELSRVERMNIQGPTAYFDTLYAKVKDNTLTIYFDYVYSGKILKSKDALYLTPIYKSSTGETFELPSIIINGRKRAPYFKRERGLLSKKEYLETLPYKAVTLKPKKGLQTITYHVDIPLNNSIDENGILEVQQIIHDCCNAYLIGQTPIQLTKAKVVKKKRMTAPVQGADLNQVTFIRPAKEVIKRRDEKVTIYINFRLNQFDIDPSYMNNQDELARVEDLIRPLINEKYSIKNIVILGYASPEGEFNHNLYLSNQRASSFKNYINYRYGFSLFPSIGVQGMGEDWDGLRRLVEESNLYYKKDVLQIIDRYGIHSGRKSQLKSLHSGYPYNELLQMYYPKLRRMEMLLTYDVSSFDLDEANGVINSRPQDLSQREMFDVAFRKSQNCDLATERSSFGLEYDLAARYFPKEKVALINASAAALVRGDLEIAWSYLSEVQSEPDAYNNLGVYYKLKGDLEKAKHYFNLALKLDPIPAKHNLIDLD